MLAMKGMLLWAGLLSGVTLSAACVQIPERPRTFTGTLLVDGSLGKTPVTLSHPAWLWCWEAVVCVAMPTLACCKPLMMQVFTLT
ncbi:hypothetical protein [Aeromonas caviae]|uniref:hypothetical protein n=1 Tax=Aeromonas caviae TaxID=648 RepID=UPI002B47EF5E|nr:hypothetical protein [Aeromonas caviae]